MTDLFFSSIFGNTQVPVIVCERGKDYPVVFANASVMLLINPLLSKDTMRERAMGVFLRDILPFNSESRFENMLSTMEALGKVDHFRTSVIDHENVPLPVSITANLVTLEGRQFFILYVHEEADNEMSEVHTQRPHIRAGLT